MLLETGKDYGLPAAPGCGASPLVVADPCDGSMTCPCGPCDRERRSRIARDVRQPWELEKAA